MALAAILSAAYSHPKPTGKRLFLVQSNVSLVLPGGTWTASKPHFWAPDYRGATYSSSTLFLGADSASKVSVGITADPNPAQSALWKQYFDEKRVRKALVAKNQGDIQIERILADSITRTVEIDAHTTGGQPVYTKTLTVYGPQRKVEIWYSVPDKKPLRQAVAASRASLLIKPGYLRKAAESYADFLHEY